MNRKIFFRFWYYFRQGWATYFAFIFGAINTLVVTYYLAIENIPTLVEIFPTFTHYVVVAIIVGIPLLTVVGYFHFKKVPAYSSEVDITTNQNPYIFKLPKKGWEIDVLWPMYRVLTIMLLKLSSDEKLSDDEITEIKKILKDIEHLSQGGWINKPKGMESQ